MAFQEIQVLCSGKELYNLYTVCDVQYTACTHMTTQIRRTQFTGMYTHYHDFVLFTL